jgi:hypothetical protein
LDLRLNIVALGDFSSVNSQIKLLQEKVIALQSNLAGVGINPNMAKDLNAMNAAFKQTMLSTNQFTVSTVKLTSETEKFGQQLEAGKLKLTDYYNIIKRRSSEATTQMKALAIEQTKLQNSVIMNDPTKQGVLSVFTPTTINKVANATKIAANEANLYAIAVNKGSQALINWGKNTQWAGRQLTVGLSVPLMLFGQQATSVFKDVNTELVRLQKVYGTGLVQPSKAALSEIKREVLSLSKELASSMGMAVKDTAAMAADLAATGLQGKDLLSATRESMRLTKLGELDTQKAMQATISLQNVYKLSTEKLSGAVNFLNAVENQTSTSLQDLVDGIPRVGPIVKQLGGDFKDTAIMMVAMKEAGVPAAQSANAIKSALASLINPTSAAKKAFMDYGISVESIATSTGGNPIKMIMALQDALKGLAPLAQAQLIEKMFGKFQEARIQALITNLGAVNSQTKTAFELANATDTQLSKIAKGELNTAIESTTGRFQRAVESMKANLIPIGEKILDFATKLLNFGNSIAKIFDSLPGPLKSLAGALAVGVALAGPIIMLTGLLGNFVGFLIRGAFNLKQLATGGKTLGTMLTPELIAAKNASQIFDAGLMSNVESIDLLNSAIKNLTINMEGMLAAMSATRGIGSVIARSAQGVPGFAGPTKYATGGFVKGNPSEGDIHPALLTGGEAVIPYPQSMKYSGFISRMIQGTLPKHNAGKHYHPHPQGQPNTPIGLNDKQGEMENGEIAFIGPSKSMAIDRSKARGAPATLQGSAEYISAASGNREAIASESRKAESRISAIGATPSALEQLKNYTQPDLQHLGTSHVTGPLNDQKVWLLSQLGLGSGAENGLLNLFSKPEKLTEDAMKKLREAANKLKLTVSKEEQLVVEEEFRKISVGEQPHSKIGTQLYGKFTESIVKEVEADAAKIRSEGKKPTSKWIKGVDKDGKIILEGRTRTAFHANQYLEARGSGRLRAQEDLIASNYVTPSNSGKNLTEVKQWAKDNPGVNATDRVFDPTSINARKVEYQKTLQQELKMLQDAGKQQTIEYKKIQENLLQIQKMKDNESLMLEIKNSRDKLLTLQEGSAEYTAVARKLGQQFNQGLALGISQDTLVAVAGKKIANAAITAVATTQKSKSPSFVARMLGRWFGIGYDKGIQDEIPATIIAGAELAGAAEIGASGGKGLKGLFKGGIGKGAGAGMAAMMIAPMITPQLAKVPGVGKELGTSASWASMASMTMNPYIIGAAAVAGFAYGGIQHLIEIEKRHEAQAKATFTASTNAMQFFGQSIANTEHQLSNFTQTVTTYDGESEILASNLKYTNNELNSFKKLITSLPTNDPLSLIIEKIKETHNSGSAAKVAQDFVNTQMAINGISKENADKLIQLILVLGGHSDIAASTSASLPTQLGAIKKLLSDSSGNAKTLQTNLGALSNLAVNTTSWEQFKAILDGIAQSGLSASQTVQGLYNYLMGIGDVKAAQAVVQLGQAGYDAFSANAVAQKLTAGGYNVDFSGMGKTSGKTLAFENAADFAKQLNDPKSALNKAINVVDAATLKSGGGTNPGKISPTLSAAELKKLNDRIAKEEKSLKIEKDKKAILDKQLKTQRDITSEIQRQQQFNLSKTDLENQIRLANASGDFMKAALLQQQLTGTTVDFANQGNLNDLQSQADKQAELVSSMQLALDEDKAALQKNTDAINANTAVKSSNGNGTTSLTGKGGNLTLPGQGGTAIPGLSDMTEKAARQSGFTGKNWMVTKKDAKGNDYKTLSDEARSFLVQQFPESAAVGGFTYQGRQYNYDTQKGKYIDVGAEGPNAPAPNSATVNKVTTFSTGSAKTLFDAKTNAYAQAKKVNYNSDQGIQFGFAGKTYSTDVLQNIYGADYNNQSIDSQINDAEAKKTTIAMVKAQLALDKATAKLKSDQLAQAAAQKKFNTASSKMKAAQTKYNKAKAGAAKTAAATALNSAKTELNTAKSGLDKYPASLIISDNKAVSSAKTALTKARGYADGGHIRGAGTATSDSIPAYLSNGEYVIKADTVSKYGTEFFDSLNAQHFANGSLGGVSALWNKFKNQSNKSATGSMMTGLLENLGTLGQTALHSLAPQFISNTSKKQNKDLQEFSGIPSIYRSLAGKTSQSPFSLQTGNKKAGKWMDYLSAATMFLPTKGAVPAAEHSALTRSLSADTIKSIKTYQASIAEYRSSLNKINSGEFFEGKPYFKLEDKPIFIKNYEDLIADSLRLIKLGRKTDTPPGGLPSLQLYTDRPMFAQNQDWGIINTMLTRKTIGKDQTVYRALSQNDLAEIVGYKKGSPWESITNRWKTNATELIAKSGKPAPNFNDPAAAAFRDFDKGININDSWIPGLGKSATDSLEWAKSIAAKGGTGGGEMNAIAKIILGKDIKGISNLMDLGLGGNRYNLADKEQFIAPFTEYVLKEINPFAHKIPGTGEFVGEGKHQYWSGGNNFSKFISEYVFEAVRTLPSGHIPHFSKGGFANYKLPSFDVGTNYVTNDMIAQIHKGEAIIPASQNNGIMGSTFNITVNAGSNADANDIAKAVMDTIKRNTAMTSTDRRFVSQ